MKKTEYDGTVGKVRLVWRIGPFSITRVRDTTLAEYTAHQGGIKCDVRAREQSKFNLLVSERLDKLEKKAKNY